MTGTELRAQLRAQLPRNATPQGAQLDEAANDGQRNTLDGELRVARPYERNSATSGATAYWWRVIRPGGEGFDFCSVPELTAAEVGERYPGCRVEVSGLNDDRRPCSMCRRLVKDRCRAADAGIRIPGAGPLHSPITDLPGRCVGYLPKPDEEEQRTGAERWPFLAEPRHG